MPSVAPFDVAAKDTMPAVLLAYGETSPDQPFVITDDRVFSAQEFVEMCLGLGGALKALDLPHGSAVGVLLPNGWRWLAATYALNVAGLVAVPLNTWYKGSELKTARRKTDLKAVISQREFSGRDYGELLSAADLTEPVAEDNYLGTFSWDSGELPTGLPTAAPLTPEQALANSDPQDAAMYVFTSGSSAEPKVVVLNHDGLVRNGVAMGRLQHVRPGDRLWYAAPLFFGLGCANAVTVALTHGLTLCVQERFEPLDAARFMAENACTVFYGLGPMMRALVAAGAHETFDLSALRTGVIGMSAEEKRLAVEVLGVHDACSIYGLTEVYGAAAMTESGDDHDVVLNTQGAVVPTHELRVVDVTTGDLLLSGDATSLGEIQLRGCVTPGYLDDPVSNAVGFTADGWFRTGDLGWLDDAGRLCFGGRLKEIVKVNGITVSPAEVETFVMSHPLVDQAYAFGWQIGTSDDEKLCCGVVLVADDQTDPRDVEPQLRKWLRDRISSYKVPEVFAFMAADAVPQTDTGKVNKRLIGELFFDLARETS